MTHDWEPCQLPNMVNDSSFGALSHYWHVYDSQIRKDRQNLTLMTVGNLVSCPIWLMTLPSEHCHIGGKFMVTKFKKLTAEPNPNDTIGNLVSCQIWLMTLP